MGRVACLLDDRELGAGRYDRASPPRVPASGPDHVRGGVRFGARRSTAAAWEAWSAIARRRSISASAGRLWKKPSTMGRTVSGDQAEEASVDDKLVGAFAQARLLRLPDADGLQGARELLGEAIDLGRASPARRTSRARRRVQRRDRGEPFEVPRQRVRARRTPPCGRFPGPRRASCPRPIGAAAAHPADRPSPALRSATSSLSRCTTLCRPYGCSADLTPSHSKAPSRSISTS